MKNFKTNKGFFNVSRLFIPVLLLTGLVFSAIPFAGMGEGSPQFRPDTTKVTYLMVLNTQTTYGTFAGYSATDTNRLFIRINDPATERIYFGIGNRTTTNAWYFRVKDPNGNIVYGPTLLPTSGTGFINYHKQVIAGPNTFNPLGYSPIVITPSAGVAGDYYIEFNYGSGTAVSNNREIGLGIFDITVGKPSAGTVSPGRIFSYNWSFNTDSYANPFYGSFYIYGADSSVTTVNLNGIKPYKFRVSCNSFGALNTGNSTVDRRSQTGFHVPPELKLFLRDPDLVAFPNGTTQFINGAITLEGCTRDSLCLQINLVKKSDVTILIDRNNNGVYNPGTADRLLLYAGVDPGPNCLPWDGKDGFGNYIPVGDPIQVQISVESGEIDLPIFDVESHETGFSMTIVRPSGGVFIDSLYYDDILVGGSANLTGCPFPCHTWASNPVNTDNNSIGNNNTINTYWFARKQSTNALLQMPDYLTTDAGSSQTLCIIPSQPDTIQISGSIAFSTSAYNGAFHWTTSGSGTFVPHDSTYTAGYVPSTADINAGGVWLFLAPRYQCDYPVDSVRITLNKIPSLAASAGSVLCFGQSTGTASVVPSNSQSPYTYNWSNGATTASQSGLTAGNYSVTVTSSNGCSASASATINQPSSAVSGTVNGTVNVSCFGLSNGSVSFSAGGGTTPYSYLWNTGAISASLVNVPAGTFTVTVTDGNGCTSLTSSIAISQPASPLTVSANSITNISCNGGSTGAITLLTAGGTTPYTYIWSNGATTQNISGLGSGSYTVTVTDANGCSEVKSYALTQPSAALSGSIAVTQQVSCFGGNNGLVDLSASGGTAPYSYLWSNGVTTQDQSGLASGNYTVTITDANGCTMTSSTVISQPVAALGTSITSANAVSCFAGNNGSVDISVNGGTTPYTYVWNNGSTSQDISGLTSGTYTVTVTDANGCTATGSTVITQPAAALAASASASQNVSCFGGANGTIALNVNGGTSPYTYLWNNGSAAQNPTSLISGSYTGTVTDANGCTVQTTTSISQPVAALASSATATQQVSCFGGSNGQIILNTAGGTSPYTYNWSNGQSSQNLSNLAAGTYSVTVTDANGCTAVASAAVTQPAASLSGSTVVTSNISCFSGNNGEINLSVSGGTSPYTYLWSNGASSQDINNLPAGSYTVTITDANGCTAQSGGIITQPLGALSANINISQNIPCFGGGSGAIDLTVSGGTTPYSYVWSNGASTQDISNLAAGNYTVTITDANGCNTTASVTITQPSAPVALSISSIQPVLCFAGTNGSVSLNITGGTFPYTFNWSNGQTSQNLLNLGAGTYSVTVTDANGCTETTSAVITQPAAALNGTASVTQQVSCHGGNNAAIDLTVTGGTSPYTYNWSNSAITQDLTGLAAGTYTVTITDANGCITNQSAVITQPAAALSPLASVTQQVGCFGASTGSATVAVTGGTSPYTYLWSTGAAATSITNLISGSYSVTVTDANGCTANSSVNISQPAAALSVSPSVSQQVSCYGGANGSISIAVSGGTTPYTYNWSNGSVSQSISGLNAGAYTVTVTDANGCTQQQSATVTQPSAALSGILSVTQNASCYGWSNGAITSAISGGTAPYSYQWSNGANTQNITSLVAGVYTLTVTDANGCLYNQSANVSQPAAALSSATQVNQNVSCYGGNNGSASVSVNGGTPPYAYFWSNGSATSSINGLSSGNYSVLITDQNGCTVTGTVNIQQPVAALTATAGAIQNVDCFGSASGSAAVSVSGGTSPYTYLWSNGAVTQNLVAVGTGTYTLTVTDQQGCTNQVQLNISQPAAALAANANVNQNVNCFGGSNGSVQLTVNGGTSPYNYSWNNGAVSQNISGLIAGTYTVTVADANGCVFSTTASVGQPVAALSNTVSVGQNISCFGGNNGTLQAITNGGTAPYAYIWNNGSSSALQSGLSAGTYSVTVTDANGCTVISGAVITQPDEALATSGNVNQSVSCFGGSNGIIEVGANGGTQPYNYLWNTGNTTYELVGVTAGTYTVTVTDANGCTSVENITVTQPVNPLTPVIGSTQSVSCFGGSNGQIVLNLTGGTTPYYFVWSNGQTTQSISNLPAGVYIVDITDANGCAATTSATITEPSAALNASATVTSNISCFSGNDGTVDLTVSGGTAPYTYLWNTGAVTQDLTGMSAGTYTVTVTDANGCSFQTQSTILQPVGALGTNIAIVQTILCFGSGTGAIDLTVTGGTLPYNYTWSNGATTQDISNLTAGVYSVTVTDNNGCNATASVNISQPSAPLASSISSTQPVLCYGGNSGSAAASANGGTFPYSYQWSNGETSAAVVNLTAGIYTVTVTDANGCTHVAQTMVTEPAAALNTAITSQQNVLCFGGNNASLGATVNGGTAPYTYQWNTGGTGTSITGLVSGTYQLIVTDANGCNTSVSATITEPSAPVSVSVQSSQNIFCFAGNNGQITLVAAGGTAPYNYLWNNGASTSGISGLISGTYAATVTDANGCSQQISATLSQPSAALSASVQSTLDVYCFGGNNGEINISVSGGTAPYSYVWNSGAITQDLTGLIAGTYTVTITDANGCTTNQSATIGQPGASLTSSTAVTANILCFGGSGGSIDLTVNGGTIPYTFIWNNGSTNEDLAGIMAGTYTVSITDNNGCTSSASATVTQPAATLSSQISATQNVSCFGGNNGSITLQVNGGTAPYQFVWSNGAITQDLTGVAAGTYSVTITDANGCSNSNTAGVMQPQAALAASVNASANVSCFGGNNGNIDVTITGGTLPYTFVWSNGETTEDISSLIAGTYSVTVTDVNGCTTVLSSTITEPVAPLSPTVTATQQISCFGGEDGSIDISVSGGTVPYTYLWNTGETTEDLSNLTFGTYVLTITDANGCEETIVVTLTQPSAPLVAVATVTSNVFCNGGNNGSVDVTANGGTPPYTYLWSNGEVTEDISNLSTGIYTVTITDANGCTATASAGIGQPAQQLNAIMTIQDVLCFNGNNGSVNLTPSGGTMPYVFLWSNGAITEDLFGLVAGTYTVTITDANGCDTSMTALVNQPAAPLIPVVTVDNHVSCYGGSDGIISVSASGGTPPYTYLWSNGQTTSTASGVAAGTYTITVTDANGCNAIISDVVTQPSAPLQTPVTVIQNVSCYSGSDGSVTTNATGGTSPYTYLWNTGATTSSLSGLTAGTYTVTVTDSKGCTYTADATVTEPLAPLSMTGTTTIANCLYGIGGDVTIQVIGGTTPYNYLWNNGSTTQNLTNMMPATYTVTVTDANGCTLIQSFTVNNQSLAVLEHGDTIICVGEFTTLWVDTIPGATYQWYFTGQPLNGATAPSFTTPAAGYYYVSVTTVCGTFNTDSIEVQVKSVENATITNNQIVCPPEMVQLHATGGVTYEWTPNLFISATNIPDPHVGPAFTTTYTVLVTNEWGCKAELYVEVGVACDTLLVPTGFSPNSDGTNDGYVIDHIDKYPGNRLWVYNRWGNLVYKARDYKNDWDGIANVSGLYLGKKVPAGTYFFILDLNDGSKPMSGYLIIRY